MIIPSFNRFPRLKACVESVLASNPIPDGGIELVVVTSTYTQAELGQLEELGATLVRPSAQTFYSASYNSGVAASRGEYLYFLDDDNVLAPDAIWQLWNALSRWRDAAEVGPVMYYGSEPSRIWCAGVERSPILLRTTLRTTLPDPLPERLESEDFPNCYMVRRSDFDSVGGFDVDRFPQHMAEGDFAKRVASATGNRVYCVTAARVWHHLDTRFVRRLHLHNRRRAFYVGRGRALYTGLYASKVQWLAFVLFGQWAIAAVYLITEVIYGSSDRWSIALSYLGGVVNGLREAAAIRTLTANRRTA